MFVQNSVQVEKKYNTSVLRMDADTTSTKNAHQKLIEEFSSGKYNVLVGTQMISKGLNFKNVSLVGIINPDASLSIPDFRSGERTYELLSQTAGRVGRFDLPGKVVIQTYNPNNYVYKSIIKNNYEEFYKEEMQIRKKLSYPPYYYLCNIMISSSSFDEASKQSINIKKILDSHLSGKYIILGPSVASIVKLNNKLLIAILVLLLVKISKDTQITNKNNIIKKIKLYLIKNTSCLKM